jgi:hypothetical protein
VQRRIWPQSGSRLRRLDPASPAVVEVGILPEAKRISARRKKPRRRLSGVRRRTITVSNFHTQLTLGGDSCSRQEHCMFTFETTDQKEVRRFRIAQFNGRLASVSSGGSTVTGHVRSVLESKRSGAMDHHHRSKRTQDQMPQAAARAPCSRVRGLLLSQEVARPASKEVARPTAGQCVRRTDPLLPHKL